MIQGAEAHAAHRDDFGSKLGMWLFLVTEMLLFGGLFISYSYMRFKYPAEFHHAGGELNATIGVLNTLVLLTSSLTVVLAIVSLQRGDRKRSMVFLGTTILLGLLFLVDKGIEWTGEIRHGLYPNSPHLATLPPGEQVFFGLRRHHEREGSGRQFRASRRCRAQKRRGERKEPIQPCISPGSGAAAKGSGAAGRTWGARVE